MPMDFPDMKSLVYAAEVHRFRKPDKGETEIAYRNALADHVSTRDLIESEEIRNGCGWDKWNKGQKKALLGRAGLFKTPWRK
jgi:hypothetical protein